MNERVKIEVLTPISPEPKGPGRRKKIPDSPKPTTLKVAVPESPEAMIEQFIIFDARCLDWDTRQELLRILPQLIHVQRDWKAEYIEFGCVSCHRKAAWYGAGGFCNDCQRKYGKRMRNRFRKRLEGSNLLEESATYTEALTLKFSTAQRLLNGGDE
jgi:hypothetical protein